MNKGCGKILYENNEGEVICGSYLSGGTMLCLKCQDVIRENDGGEE